MTHFCPCIVNRLVNRSTIYCGDFLAKIKNSSIQNSATPKPCILDDFGRRRTQIYRNKSRTNAAESAIRQGFGAGSYYYCYPRDDRNNLTVILKQKSPEKSGLWRRWRELNPRVAINDLSVFKTDLFGHLSTPPYMKLLSQKSSYVNIEFCGDGREMP